MTEHTKLPWSVQGEEDIWSGEPEYPGKPLFRAAHKYPFNLGVEADERAANAAYIVKACNAYPELVKALTELHRVASADYQLNPNPHPHRTYAIELAQAALAKVKPPAPTCDDFVGGRTNDERA